MKELICYILNSQITESNFDYTFLKSVFDYTFLKCFFLKVLLFDCTFSKSAFDCTFSKSAKSAKSAKSVKMFSRDESIDQMRNLYDDVHHYRKIMNWLVGPNWAKLHVDNFRSSDGHECLMRMFKTAIHLSALQKNASRTFSFGFVEMRETVYRHADLAVGFYFPPEHWNVGEEVEFVVHDGTIVQPCQVSWKTCITRNDHFYIPPIMYPLISSQYAELKITVNKPFYTMYVFLDSASRRTLVHYPIVSTISSGCELVIDGGILYENKNNLGHNANPPSLEPICFDYTVLHAAKVIKRALRSFTAFRRATRNKMKQVSLELRALPGGVDFYEAQKRFNSRVT